GDAGPGSRAPLNSHHWTAGRTPFETFPGSASSCEAGIHPVPVHAYDKSSNGNAVLSPFDSEADIVAGDYCWTLCEGAERQSRPPARTLGLRRGRDRADREQ